MRTTFTSSAGADVMMLAPYSQDLLRLLGHEGQSRGAILAADLPAALARLEAALAEIPAPPATQDDASVEDDPDQDAVVGLKQRAWPVLELMRRSIREQTHIMWSSE